MSAPFVHLHLHTEYSIVDSIVQVKPLCSAVKNENMPAVAITDICNLFGMVKFYKAALANGIKPIVGAELWVENEDKNGPIHKLVLLCQNMQGYQNLTRLISKAYQEGEHGVAPLVKKSWIKDYCASLIALSGAQFGEIGQALVNEPDTTKASQLLNTWMNIFPNRFYLEIQRNNRVSEKAYERNLLTLAHAWQCPLVATNEVVFLKQSDFDAHKARVCIQEGTTLEQSAAHQSYSQEQYFKSSSQMWELFQDIPNALVNTVEIAKRCSLSLTLDESVLPTFPVPENMTEESLLQRDAQVGLSERLRVANKSPAECEVYQERLNSELKVINTMGYPGYFLIVADFIQWAKANHIPVGPGRGSGAGSLVAYALSITDLDPIEYELLFERFLNPERVSMPDFDIDFCMDNRDRVIDYVANRYGRNNVSQIATFGTMAAKAVIRDVGRVLAYPYGFVDKIAKLVPFEIGMTLEKALVQEPALLKRYQEEEEVKNLIDLAKKLEGITRNVGKHAGGVVIAPAALTNYAPFFCDKESAQVVIQFDKDDVEAIGLVKFDFLGLKTLTIIDWAVQNANHVLEKKGMAKIDIQTIPLDDAKTFALLKSCATTAIFQLESRGMKELIKRLQPDEFEEIIALVALFRPGPLQSGMVDDFINRKHGRAKVEYPHPAIEPILKPTYGVILYQEQVMQIAQTLAGYTLGGADLLRRAMGKKKPEEMAKQRAIFTGGATSRGVEERTATYIFDLMEKFAGYGFNKSHSAAYALVSYQTAWLKTHFASAFMAAVLSADMSNTDKMVIFIEECRQCGIIVKPPNVQLSQYAFTVNEANEIVYGLGAIKGVGEAAIGHILEQRQQRTFRDIFDFCERLDGKKISRRVLESLIKSGSMDCFGEERAALMASLDEALKQAEQMSKNLSFGQSDLFQHFELSTPRQPLIMVRPWSTEERLQGEKESLGTYLSGHPLEALEPELKKLRVIKFNEIPTHKKDGKCVVAGLVVSLRTLQTKNGDRMAVVMLDDRFNRFEVTLFPDTYTAFRELLVKDQLLIIEGNAAPDTYTGGMKVRAQTLHTFASARALFAKKINISLPKDKLSAGLITQLKDCLRAQERGKCPIYIHYQNEDAKATLKLDNQWSITPNAECLMNLAGLFSNEMIEVEY